MSHLRIAETPETPDDPPSTGGGVRGQDIQLPAATFKTLRVVLVEFGTDSFRAFDEFLEWQERDCIVPIAGGRRHSGVPQFQYSAFYLPNHARQIEAWLQEHGAERVKMVVGGVEVEP